MELNQLTRTVAGLDTKELNILSNVLVDSVPKTDLMVNILEILDETGPYSGVLSEHNRSALLRLLLRYVDSCWPVYLEGVKIDNLFPYMQTTVYHVNAADGYRVATINEVANGVSSLVGEVTDNIPEKDQRLLKLLQWTFDGSWRTFKSAGYDIKFNSDRTVATTYMQMLGQAGKELNDLVDYMDDGKQFDYCLTTLRNVKRAGKYKYPQYAPDEIKVDVSLKQLIFMLKQQLPKGSSNPDIRRAWYLVLHTYSDSKGQKNPNPSDVAFLRNVYTELTTKGSSFSGNIKQDDEDRRLEQQKLKDKCDRLLAGRDNHLIKSNHFAFKIIETLQRIEYSRVSIKQMTILEDALKELDVNSRAKENVSKSFSNIVDVDTASSSDEIPNVFDVASMLGDGLIGKL